MLKKSGNSLSFSLHLTCRNLILAEVHNSIFWLETLLFYCSKVRFTKLKETRLSFMHSRFKIGIYVSLAIIFGLVAMPYYKWSGILYGFFFAFTNYAP